MTKQNIDTSIFYDFSSLLSYKCLYNICTSVRGIGKTYNITKRCIKLGIEQKKISFVILVRYKEDIDDIKNSWWSIVEHLFEGYTFFTLRKTIYCKDNKTGDRFPIGEFIALTQYARAKKTPRPYVKYIVFDEFLNEDNDYLKDEVNKFLNICDSIIRLRDNVRVILISNTISILNPYFDYFGFTKFDKQFQRGEHDSILEFNAGEEFIKVRKKTKFGSSIDNTKYGDFSLNAKFMLDDTTNVMEKPKGSSTHYLYSIVLDNLPISCYLVNNIMYVSNNRDITRKAYTPYVNDAKTTNALFVEKNFKFFREISKYFMSDKMIFETLEIKNAIINFVRFLMGVRYK